MHSHIHAFTHTLDLHASFQPPKAKTVAAKRCGKFSVGQPTDRHNDPKSCWSKLKMGEGKMKERRGIPISNVWFPAAASYSRLCFQAPKRGRRGRFIHTEEVNLVGMRWGWGLGKLGDEDHPQRRNL